jgi:hypothetical protein
MDGVQGIDLMPEPVQPDFAQIVLALVDTIFTARAHTFQSEADIESIVGATMDGFRQVWNARGAADLNLFIGEMDQRWIVKAIKALDC